MEAYFGKSCAKLVVFSGQLVVISGICTELVVFSGQLVVRRGRGAPKNLPRAPAPKAPELVTSAAAARAPPAVKKSTTAPALILRRCH